MKSLDSVFYDMLAYVIVSCFLGYVIGSYFNKKTLCVIIGFFVGVISILYKFYVQNK